MMGPSRNPKRFVVLPGCDDNPGIYDHGPTAEAQVEGYPDGEVRGSVSIEGAEGCWMVHVPSAEPNCYFDWEDDRDFLVVFVRRPCRPAVRLDLEGDVAGRLVRLLDADA